MIAKKIITSYKPVDLQIAALTLLTKEQVDKAVYIIPRCRDYWWTQSPADGYTDAAMVVSPLGGGAFQHDVKYEHGIRPCIMFDISQDPETLDIKDTFTFVGEKWTVILPGIALCDRIVAYSMFNVYDAIERRSEKNPEPVNYFGSSMVHDNLYKWGESVMIFDRF